MEDYPVAKQTKGLSFGAAISELKEGRSVAREGWNGKGMYLWLNRGSAPSQKDYDVAHIDGIRTDLFLTGDEGTVTRLPNINMCSATGATVTGWVASATDMLAEDWCIVE